VSQKKHLVTKFEQSVQGRL